MNTTPLPHLKIHLYRGDDETAIIEARDDCGKRADLNGYRLDADCFDTASGELVWHLSSESGEISHPKLGEIQIDIPHSYTETAQWQKLVFDLQLTDPKGKIKTIATGEFWLEADITQSYSKDNQQ